MNNNNNKAKNNTTKTKDTKLVDNPIDNKSNHNRWRPEWQKVWSLDPIQSIIWKVESDCLWQEMPCNSGRALQNEKFWQIYPQDKVVEKISN